LVCCFVVLFALVLLFPCFSKFNPAAKAPFPTLQWMVETINPNGSIWFFSINRGAQKGMFLTENPRIKWMI